MDPGSSKGSSVGAHIQNRSACVAPAGLLAFGTELYMVWLDTNGYNAFSVKLTKSRRKCLRCLVQFLQVCHSLGSFQHRWHHILAQDRKARDLMLCDCTVSMRAL